MEPRLVLLLVYGAALIAVGLWASRHVSRSSQFFVAARSLSGPMVFATMLAANIGAGSTVGAAGLAYRQGLSGLVVVGLRRDRLPRDGSRGRAAAASAGHGARVPDGGDFLEWRFDRSVRVLIAAVLWAGTLALLAGQLLAMGLAFEVIAGTPRAVGALLSTLILIAYFGRGGLQAAAFVNLLQLATLLVGFAAAVPFAWAAGGGWAGMRAAAGPDAAGFASFTGMGLSGILGLAVVFVPSFIVSPGLNQKAFAARSPSAAGPPRSEMPWRSRCSRSRPSCSEWSMRAAQPALANPELALPRLTTDVLPPWLGGLPSPRSSPRRSRRPTRAVMLSTSLSRDLFQAVLRPKATDAELLRVGRLAIVVGSALSLGLALLLPSVATALRLFYGVMTAALFVPFVVGLWSRRPGALHARVAIVVSIAATLGLLIALRGRPEGEWLPSAVGILLAALVFASAWLGRRPGREAGASIESI